MADHDLMDDVFLFLRLRHLNPSPLQIDRTPNCSSGVSSFPQLCRLGFLRWCLVLLCASGEWARWFRDGRPTAAVLVLAFRRSPPPMSQRRDMRKLRAVPGTFLSCPSTHVPDCSVSLSCHGSGCLRDQSGGTRTDTIPDRGWRRRFDDPIPLPRGRRGADVRPDWQSAEAYA
jgi:hypothetical protein